MDFQSVGVGICVCLVAIGVIWICKNVVKDWLYYYIRKQIANSVDVWRLNALMENHSDRLKAIEEE